MLVLALAAVLAPRAHAHGVTLIVSRSEEKRPRLQVNGSSDYREGKLCIEMLKGDAMFAGTWIDDAPGISTLRKDGVTRTGARLLPGHRVALKLLHADKGLVLIEPSTWNVVLARKGDVYEFHRDERGDFSLQMLARYDREGSPQAKFQFVDQAGLHRPSEPFTLRFCTVTSRDTTRLPRPIVAPLSYREALAVLRPRFHDAGSALAVGNLRQAGDEGMAMRTIVAAIPSLARAQDSGVPVASQAVVDSQATRALSAASDLQLASDLGDTLAARQHLERIRLPLAALETFLPLVYTCPMGCENGKTYAAPGKCPVCGMRLTDARAHADHTPKHGGVFMMSPDFAHHLEAALASERELHVYIYDEFTDPIPADSMRAHVVLGRATTGGTESSIAMRRGGSPELLTAALPPNLKFPVQLTLVVDFHDGSGEQSFDVQLARPLHNASAP
jgi:hypothetical protein